MRLRILFGCWVGFACFPIIAQAKVYNLPVPARGTLHVAGIKPAASPIKAAQAVVAKYPGLGAGSGQMVVDQSLRFGDHHRVRLIEQHNSIPVWGGESVVTLDEQNNVLGASSETLSSRLPGLHADISLADAARRAVAVAPRMKVIGHQLAIYDPSIFGAPGGHAARLVWKIDVRAGMEHYLIVLDAHSGEVVLKLNQQQQFKHRLVCDLTKLAEDEKCTRQNAARLEGSSPIGNQEVDLAYDTSGALYDFYFNRFGRDSVDGSGMDLVSYIGLPASNAYWSSGAMTYGAGFATADDVVGHEMTHGVTEASSGLVYMYQSGAINEAMSDIMGELFDQSWDNGSGNDGPDVRWKMGEDLPLSVGVIRDMKNPELLGQPARTGSEAWFADPDDNGGVHINSGVANKAAYLLTDGDTFNGVTVQGLGISKAARLFYTTNTQFLRSGSNYQDLGIALRTACASLPEIFNSNDCAQVDLTIAATEMDVVPHNSGLPSAQVCKPGHQIQSSLLHDDFRPQSLVNNWHQTGNDWKYARGPSSDDNVIQVWQDPGFDALIKSTVDATVMYTGAPVQVNSRSYLRLRHQPSGPGFEPAIDGAVVEWSDNVGKTWHDLQALPHSHPMGGYTGRVSKKSGALSGRLAFTVPAGNMQDSRWSLTDLSGKKVYFRLRYATNRYEYGGWIVDDISVYNCPVGGEPNDWQASQAKDLTPPEVEVSNDDYQKFKTPGSIWKVTFKSNEPASTFVCRTTYYEPWQACSSPSTTVISQEGKLKLYIRARDAAGNMSLQQATGTSFTDWTKPQMRFVKKSSHLIRAGVLKATIIPEEDLDAVRCQLDNGKQYTCVNKGCREISLGGNKPMPKCFDLWENWPQALEFNIRLAGHHVLRLWGIDTFGNQQAIPLSLSFYNDTSAPRITVHRLHSNQHNHPRFSIKIDEPAKVHCLLATQRRRGHWVACRKIWRSYDALARGNYRLWVRAVDVLKHQRLKHIDFRVR